MVYNFCRHIDQDVGVVLTNRIVNGFCYFGIPGWHSVYVGSLIFKVHMYYGSFCVIGTVGLFGYFVGSNRNRMLIWIS